ncbi:MAG: hypothetical protein ABJA67_14070, partial [Chthonomonadales bacterium]
MRNEKINIGKSTALEFSDVFPMLVFATCMGLILVHLYSRFHLALDEGIYLTSAHRVAQGQAPYRDFFALTGPLDFWLHGLVFKILGPSLAAAQAVLACELALLCAAIYWLTARFTTNWAAASTAALYLAMLLTSPYQLYVNHRWDSNTLIVLAAAALWAGVESQKRKFLLIAGVLAGAA